MCRIIFKAPATVFDYRNSDDGTPIEEPALLRTYDGYVYKDECFDEHMSGINDRELEEAGVSGGYLEFKYQEKNNTLYAITEYQLQRKLNDSEVLKLRKHTVGQWSDGIGSNLYYIGMTDDRKAIAVECFVDKLIETQQVIN